MTWLRPDITAAKTWYNHLFKTIKKMATFKNSLTIFKKNNNIFQIFLLSKAAIFEKWM